MKTSVELPPQVFSVKVLAKTLLGFLTSLTHLHFYRFFRKYLKYNTVDYIIMCVRFLVLKTLKLIGGNNNEVRKISINWGINF